MTLVATLLRKNYSAINVSIHYGIRKKRCIKIQNIHCDTRFDLDFIEFDPSSLVYFSVWNCYKITTLEFFIFHCFNSRNETRDVGIFTKCLSCEAIMRLRADHEKLRAVMRIYVPIVRDRVPIIRDCVLIMINRVPIKKDRVSIRSLLADYENLARWKFCSEVQRKPRRRAGNERKSIICIVKLGSYCSIKCNVLNSNIVIIT